jgi:hypothetical protein
MVMQAWNQYYRTAVDAPHVPAWRLRVGQTLPADATVSSVKLDGEKVRWRARVTNRGLEVTVRTRPGRHEVVISAA